MVFPRVCVFFLYVALQMKKQRGQLEEDKAADEGMIRPGKLMKTLRFPAVSAFPRKVVVFLQ